MDIPVGTQLGPYEIVAVIGAGGMDQVYKAISQLNHPNICTLDDVGVRARMSPGR